MNRSFITICAIALTTAVISAMPRHEQTADGIVVIPDSGATVRIKVLGDKIVRVSAVPDGKFAPDNSLVVLPQPQYANFDITEESNCAIVSTPALRVVINDLNYNYEKGFYSKIEFVWNDEASTLTIGDRQGRFPGMLEQRKFNIIKVDPSHPKGYLPSNQGVNLDYVGKLISIHLQ